MAVKDGLPSTDFSRMNREWVKKVAEESGGAGLPHVTEADNGKILGVVNGAWGAMDAGGGGSSDFSTAEITLNLTYPEGVTPDLEGYGRYTLTVPQNTGGTLTSDLVTTTNHKIFVLLYQGGGVSLSWPDFEGVVGDDTYYIPDGTPTCSGGLSYDSGTQTIVVTGDGTISGTMVLDE